MFSMIEMFVRKHSFFLLGQKSQTYLEKFNSLNLFSHLTHNYLKIAILFFVHENVGMLMHSPYALENNKELRNFTHWENSKH